MTQPIGIFDSGVGGLSVLRHVRARLPYENIVYVADQAHVPYGMRSAENVTALSRTVTEALLAQDAKLIVVACNTASAAALTHLREAYPYIPFVGMEPAVKPGARATVSGKVGVLATAGTFKSQRYESLMARFAADVKLFEDPCVGLVERIEAGAIDDPDTERLLRAVLEPMLAQGVDTFVLGCTHYPFVQPLIEQIVGRHGTVIDPAPAVARHVERTLLWHDLWGISGGQTVAYTTGDVAVLKRQVDQLLGSAFAIECRDLALDSHHM